jgi:hypothetical protein
VEAVRSEPVPARDTDLWQAVLRWRTRLLSLVLLLILAELVFPQSSWPESARNFAFFLYLAGKVVVLALAIPFGRALYRFALAGGPGYAAGHVLIAVLLCPLGTMLVPGLVADDIDEGRAAWRRRNSRSFQERLLRTLLYFAALIPIAVVLWQTVPWLLILAPIIAFFLQRLALPWFREPAD